MSVFTRIRDQIIAGPELSVYLSQVDEELDMEAELTAVLYPPVPARRP